MTLRRNDDQQNFRCAREEEVVFGPPSPLVFGGAGAAGVSNALSRADHVHEVPELPRLHNNLASECFVFTEMVYAGAPNHRLEKGAVGRSVELDIVGNKGALGSLGPVVAGAGRSGASYFAAEDLPSGDTTRTDHTAQRLRGGEFLTRVRIGNNSAVNLRIASAINDFVLVLGCVRTTFTENLTGIESGIYFIIEYSGTTTTGWRGACTSATGTTEVAFGTPIEFDPSTSLPTLETIFQTFRITMNADGSEVTFGLRTANATTFTEKTVSTNIPQDTTEDAVCGWGIFLDRTDTALVNPSVAVTDLILFRGTRE